MKKITKVENFKKGDIIIVIENHPMWNSKTETLEDVIFHHKFEIIRNNPKTYGCRYIEGAHKNMGFNWIKGYDLTKNTKIEYFI